MANNQSNRAAATIEQWKMCERNKQTTNEVLDITNPIALEPVDVPSVITITNNGGLVITGVYQVVYPNFR